MMCYYLKVQFQNQSVNTCIFRTRTVPFGYSVELTVNVNKTGYISIN